MTRKDYVIIARALAEFLASPDRDAYTATHVFCSALKADNANFNPDRFVAAVNADLRERGL